MGKQRVYGKKTGASTLNSYSKFAVDSSEHEISRDGSVLNCISINIQPVRVATTRAPVCKNQLQESLRTDSRLLKGNPPNKTGTDGLRQQQAMVDQQGDVRSSIHETALVSPRPQTRYSLESQLHLETPSYVARKVRQGTKTPMTDDLSTMFASLGLRASPDPSISISRPSPPSISPHQEIISPEKKSYLDPILRCKNVTPNVSEFPSWMAARLHLALEKIGEGSFGEVFRATSANGETVILKLMPLNAMKGRGSKSFTSVHNAANEIRLLERMQRVPGFVEFRGACVLVGSLPETFINLWMKYKSSGRTVESRDPSKKTSYPTDQLWLLIEMSDAGHNLEPGQYAPPGGTSIKGQRYLGIGRAWDIFWEVAKSIAKAECWAQFEHRDLHLGNICAKDTINIPDEEDLTLVNKTNTTPIPINTSRLEITIIDYSLSRAYMDNEDDVLFYDFKKDKHLLKGEGDLQYDMYRYMAAAVGDRPCKEFVPETNIVWLWFVLNRILAMTKLLSSKAKAKRRGLITMEARKWNILNEVQDLIKPENMDSWAVNSAAALLATGVEQGWLLADDVMR